MFSPALSSLSYSHQPHLLHAAVRYPLTLLWQFLVGLHCQMAFLVRPNLKIKTTQTAKRQKPLPVSWWCSPTSGNVDPSGQICYGGEQPQQYSVSQSLTDLRRRAVCLSPFDACCSDSQPAPPSLRLPEDWSLRQKLNERLRSLCCYFRIPRTVACTFEGGSTWYNVTSIPHSWYL